MISLYYLFLTICRALTDREAALRAQLTVLVYHAVDAPFTHGLTVVNVLRCERSAGLTEHLYQEKCHPDSNY